MRRKLNDIFHKPISFCYVLKYLYGCGGRESNNAMVTIVDVNNVFLKVITIEQQNEKSKVCHKLFHTHTHTQKSQNMSTTCLLFISCGGPK